MKKIFYIAFLCLPLLFNGCAKRIVNTNVSIYGTVVDAQTYAPIQGAILTLTPSSKTRYTGSDGTYQFEDLNKQQYTIRVQMPGYLTDSKTVNLSSGEREEVTFALKKE